MGYAQLMGFKGGFAPLAGLGAQRPHLYPHPDPPQRGGSKRLDSGDLRSPDPRPGAEPLDPKTKGEAPGP